MKKRYDAVIIGAGHNGLTAAASLAQAGKSVLVLEKRETLGGAAASEALWPGYQVNTGADQANLFQDAITQSLFLKMNGLEFREGPAYLHALQTEGPGLTIYQDVERSQAAIAPFSQRDADRFPEFVAQVNRFTAVLRDMLLQTPPNLNERSLIELIGWGNIGLKLRRLGGKSMMELLRILPLPARNYLNEWFESELLKGGLGVSAVTGMRQGPRSAGTTLQFLYQNINGFPRFRVPAGGMGALATALATAAQQNGAEVRLGAGVAQIQVDNNQAIAVLLQNGDQIPAQVVLASTDPRLTLFGLVGPQKLEPSVMRAVRNIAFQGSTAKLLLGLSGMPTVIGVEDVSRLAGHIRLAPSLNYIEKAYDAAKYGHSSEKPVLDMTIPTLLDPSLAPPGQHILSIVIRYAPYRLANGDWPTAGEALATAVIDTLAAYMPNLAELISHKQLITPLDYEETYGLSEGSIFQGKMGLDQLLVMRPIPGWSQYRTPIKQLYLCGAGAHPGGGVTGAPGYNAARLVLDELA